MKNIISRLPKGNVKRLAILAVIILAIPVTVILVRRVVLYFSRAQVSQPVFYFAYQGGSPPNLTTNGTTTLTLRLDPKGTKISGASVRATFPRTMIELASAIDVSASPLSTVIVAPTSVSTANSTGEFTFTIGVPLGGDINLISPSTDFELAKIQVRAITTQTNQTANINIVTSSTQIIDPQGNSPAFTVTPGTIRINWTSTPTPTMATTGTPTTVPTGAMLRGDANCDGSVNTNDYSIWLSYYLSGSPPQSCPNDPDFDNNGSVTGVDYVIWLKNFGTVATPTPTLKPTNTPTPIPTNTPTPKPTSTPTPKPTSTPTPKPTSTPTPTLIPSVTPTPTPGSGDTVYGFEDITVPPTGGVSAVNGTHSGINFGTGAWVADTSATVLNHMAGAFSTEVTSRSFTIPSGKVLKSVLLAKATNWYAGSNGTATTINYTISDGVNPIKSGTVFFGQKTTLITGWTLAGTTITITGNWDLYIDDITYGNPTIISPTPTPPISSTPTPATGLAGDANCDSTVDLIDYAIWRNHYVNGIPFDSCPGSTSNRGEADFIPRDGKIDLIDYAIWRSHYTP